MKDLLLKIKLYIEEAEEEKNGEWGSGKSLAKLIVDGEMPDLYSDVINALENDWI